MYCNKIQWMQCPRKLHDCRLFRFLLLLCTAVKSNCRAFRFFKFHERQPCMQTQFLKKLSPKCNTKSRSKLFSVILYGILHNKLLTEHHRNIAHQQFCQSFNDTDCNFPGQISEEQMKALLNNVPLGYEQNRCLSWRDYFDNVLGYEQNRCLCWRDYFDNLF